MHYFSNLFDKVLYMFQTDLQSIIRSISTLYTRNRYLSCQLCWLSASRQPTELAKYLLLVYSVEILLMMDCRSVRNIQSTLSNKSEKQCITLAFIVRIYHYARSSECQIYSLYKGLLISAPDPIKQLHYHETSAHRAFYAVSSGVLSRV